MSTLQNKNFHSNLIRPKKSLRFLVIGQLYFFGHLFFFDYREICDTCICIAGTKFPIHKVWWLREASQIRQTFIPLSSNAGGNWTSFHSKEKIKIKNADARV